MRFPDITLAAFKPITLVEIPDEEVIIAGRMAKVKERWAVYDPPMAAQYDVEGLEFDPIKITMEAGAAYEMNALTRINQMGRATTLAFAWGDNLDAIASRYPGGVPRLPEETYSAGADPGEKEAKDNRYRRRIWLAPNALAASGPTACYPPVPAPRRDQAADRRCDRAGADRGAGSLRYRRLRLRRNDGRDRCRCRPHVLEQARGGSILARTGPHLPSDQRGLRAARRSLDPDKGTAD
jgi:hypothetical protein